MLHLLVYFAVIDAEATVLGIECFHMKTTKAID